MKENEAIKELHGIRPRGGIIPQKRAEAIDVAIKALEKQIPKKPIIKPTSYCHAYHCPVCNGYIRSTTTRKEVILDENIFCGICGQQLNWSEEE